MAKRKKGKKSAGKKIVKKKGGSSLPLAEIFAQNPDWVALGLFIFLVAIFFHEVIFGSKIYFTPDLQAPAALAAPLKDALWKHGIYPFWSPYIFAGMPSFASLIYTPFTYLPYILFTLLEQIVPLPPLFVHILHYPLAGLGVYLFLREFKVDILPALLGGIAYMFTPYLITMEAFGHGSQMMTAAYMPMALWALERFMKQGNWLNIGIAALVLGIQLQRGHVQIVYYTWMVLGAYFVYRLFHHFRTGEKKKIPLIFARFLVVVILAFGLSAVLYLSVYEYMPYSIRGSAPILSSAIAQKGVGFEYATQWSFSPGEMLTFFIPSFYGFGGQTYWGTMPFTDYPNYMGILVLLLAIWALIYYRRSPVGFFGLVIFIALLISFGKNFAIFYKLFYNYLPFFNRFRVPVMVLIVVQMGIAILAGFGLQQILSFLRKIANQKSQAVLAKRLLQIAGAVLVIAVLLSIAKSSFFSVMQSFYPNRYTQDLQLQLDRQRFDMLFKDWWLISFWVMAGLSSLALTLRNNLKIHNFALVILIITLADLWAVDFKLNQPVSKSNLDRYLSPDEVARFLKADTTLYRIFPTGNLFNKNRWAAQSIQSIGGYHAAKPRVFQDFMDATALAQNYAMKYYQVISKGGKRMLQPLPPGQIDFAVRENHQNLIDFLNIKYLLSPYPIPEPALRLKTRVRYFMGNQPISLNIYENRRVLPRAYLVGAYKLMSSPREALAFLQSDKFNPREHVLLYQKPEPQPVPDSTAFAELISYGLHRIQVRTKSEKPQLLVLSDTYYPPGWHATIDGKPVTILQANHAFRAVAVPAGTHKVQFSFHSRAFTLGLWISLVSLLTIAGCIFMGIKENKRPRPSG